MLVSSIKFTSNIPNNSSQKKSESVCNMGSKSITSSYDDSKANQAILNNLSFRGVITNPEDKKSEEATKLVIDAFDLRKQRQFDLSFSQANEDMYLGNISEIVKDGYKYTRDDSNPRVVVSRTPLDPNSDIEKEVYDYNNSSRTTYYKNGKRDVEIRTCGGDRNLPVKYRYIIGYKDGQCEKIFNILTDIGLDETTYVHLKQNAKIDAKQLYSPYHTDLTSKDGDVILATFNKNRQLEDICTLLSL